MYNRRLMKLKERLYLYNEGDECEEVAGGISLDDMDDGSFGMTYNAATKFDTYLQCAVTKPSGSTVESPISTANAVTKDSYTKVYVEYELVTYASGVTIYLFTTATNSYPSRYTTVQGRPTSVGTYTLSLTFGSETQFRIWAFLYLGSSSTTSSSATIKIKKIWLE